MNRAERRAREKEKKKESNKKVEALAWFRALPPTKRVLIDSLVNIKAEEKTSNMLEAIYRCLSAALIQGLEDLEAFESVMYKLDEVEDDKYASFAYEIARNKANDLSFEGIGYPLIKGRSYIKDMENENINISMIDEDYEDIEVEEL